MIVRPQQHWLRRIFVWHGSVLSKISSRLLLNFLFSIAVIFMLPRYTHLGIKFTLAPFSILGVAIAIFLGFRNNAGYARYVEARKLWGQLMIASRSLLREVKTTLPDSAKCKEFARLQIAFAHCLRMTLRKQPQAEVLAHYLKTEDLQPVLASNSPANRILLIMGSGWRFSAAMGSFQISCLLASTIGLTIFQRFWQAASALPIRQFPLPTP